jgi:hypothetical protein
MGALTHWCNSVELRRRFVKAEMELFRVRYEEELGSELRDFLDTREFGYHEVRDHHLASYVSSEYVRQVLEEEQKKYAEQLKNATPKNYVSFSKKVPAKSVMEEKFYKVPCLHVVYLLGLCCQ